MIDFELKELLRKAYKAGRRNALKQDELNFNDFIKKHESKLKLFAIPAVSVSCCPVCKNKNIAIKHDKTRAKCLHCAHDWAI